MIVKFAKCLLIATVLILSCGEGNCWVHGGAVSSFNGGKSQIQSGDFAAGGFGDEPFINALKYGTSWLGSAGTPSDGTVFDTNGYPKSIPAADTKFTTTVFIPLSRDTDTWIAACDGNGSILVNTVTTNSSGGNIRYTFVPNTTQINFAITAVGTPNVDYPHNCRLLDANDETLYNQNVATGKAWGGFNPTFLSRLAASGAGVFRFMQLQNGNTANTALWSDRKPTNYVYYTGGEYRASAWNIAVNNCTTSTLNICGNQASTGATPTDRQTVQLRWPATINNPATVTYSGTAGIAQFTWTGHSRSVGDQVAFTGSGTPPAPFAKATVASKQVYCVASVIDANTLTLGSCPSGSITVTNSGSGSFVLAPVVTFSLNTDGSNPIPVSDQIGNFPLQSGFNAAPVSGADATLKYDASLGVYMKYGTPGTQNTRGYLDTGWPYELMVELCAEARMHPYFTLPYLAGNVGTIGNYLAGGTDFIPQLAAYIKANGPSWMVPRFEGPNEAWNPSFYALSYYTNKALVYNSGAVTGWNTNNLYGADISIMGQAVNAVYGGAVDATKYQIFAGVQTHSSSPSSNGTSGSNDRLNASAYVTAGGSAAKNWATHVVIDQYISSSAFGLNQEFAWASDYAINGTTANLNAYVDMLNNGGTAPNGNFNLDFMNALYGQWFTFAQGFTNKDAHALKLAGYEGGYTVLYPQGLTPTSTITAISATNPAVLTLPVSFIPFVFGRTMAGARVHGFISGTTLTVNSYSGSDIGTVQGTAAVTGPGVAANTYLTAGSSTTGTSGTYTITPSQTVGSVGSPIALSIGNAGNPAVVGMQVVISGAASSCPALNGNTYNITAVSGDSVTINADATTCGSFSGTATATYQKDSTTTGSGLNVLNLFRRDTKNLATHLQGYTYGGVSGSQSNYGNFVNAGGEFPSQFNFAGSAYSPPYGTGIAVNSAQSWGMYDPDIYAAPSSAQSGIAAFNAH